MGITKNRDAGGQQPWSLWALGPHAYHVNTTFANVPGGVYPAGGNSRLVGGMRLQCLLVTQEHQLLELVRPVLESAGMDVEVRAEAASAGEICGRRHLDGFVVDCDDIEGGRDLLSEIRGSRSNRMSTVFAVVNGVTSISEAMESGANFVLGKPMAQERFEAYLEMARASMEREHRRYFRFAVNLPVHVRGAEEMHAAGLMVNLSEGGLAIRLPASCSLPEMVRLEFDVPSIEPFTVQAKGEVVWRDSSGLIGARFLYMSEESRQRLQEWLDQLYAQFALQGMEDETKH